MDDAGVDAAELPFRLATRWAVVAGNADICMGGKVITEAPFFGSVDESV